MIDRPSILLHAAWVAPMTGPVLRDAGVIFRDGFIADVGPTRLLRVNHLGAIEHDAGNAIILPGLVNAHTHLELTNFITGNPPGRFLDWILDLMRRVNPTQAHDATLAGIQQCLRFGITTIGDISSQPAITRPLLTASRLRGTSYGEVRGMAQRRSFLEARLAAAVMTTGSDRIRPGISPHAPYSIEITGIKRCVEAALANQLPLTIHLAETREEAEFLRDQTGPFKELWDHLSAWDDNVPRFAGGPIRLGESIGLLDFPTLLAHVNYCDDAEMELLSRGSASVVYCPRTHAFFGHPPHRWRDMLARGINLAIGTDSCASSPDLNLVDDLRLLHQIAPEMESTNLWNLVTVNAARALGMPLVGSLSPGCLADAVVFPTQSTTPLKEILERDLKPSQVWIAGEEQRVGRE